MKQNKTTYHLVLGGVIAAAYVVLTYLSAAFGLAYGPIQFRISEALCILPVFTPAAIWGLTIGCVLSNILSSYGVVDMIFGTAATLIATLATRMLRNKKVGSLPLASFFPPVISNAVIVGAEIAILSETDSFWFSALTVGIGEIASVFVLGIPLYYALRNKKIF